MNQSMTVPNAAETLGLDIGDRQTAYCHLSAEGEELRSGDVPTTPSALKSFFRELTPCRMALEASGPVHWVSELARQAGHDVIVANPRELRLISQSRRKNDRNDARILAQLGRLDPTLLRPVHLRGEVCRMSRSLLHARDQLVRTRTRLVNLVRG